MPLSWNYFFLYRYFLTRCTVTWTIKWSGGRSKKLHLRAEKQCVCAHFWTPNNQIHFSQASLFPVCCSRRNITSDFSAWLCKTQQYSSSLFKTFKRSAICSLCARRSLQRQTPPVLLQQLSWDRRPSLCLLWRQPFKPTPWSSICCRALLPLLPEASRSFFLVVCKFNN